MIDERRFPKIKFLILNKMKNNQPIRRYKKIVRVDLIMIGRLTKIMHIWYNNKMPIKLNNLEKIAGWIILLAMNGKAIRLSYHQARITKGQIIKFLVDERLKFLSNMWRRFPMNYWIIRTTLTFLMGKINEFLQPKSGVLVVSSTRQLNIITNLMPSTKQITL